MIKGPDGAIYRLNKVSGEIKIIKMGTYISEEPIFSGTGVVNLPVDEKELESSRDWCLHQISGKNLTVQASTYWKKGQIYLTFKVYPYKSLMKMFQKKDEDVYYRLKKHGFSITMVNESGFEIVEFFVELSKMEKYWDKNAEGNGVLMNLNTFLGASEYVAITDYSFESNLDWIYIPNYGVKDKVSDLIQEYDHYGEVNHRLDMVAPRNAKYWSMKYPDKKKIYFSTEEELLRSYENSVINIIETNQ